MKLDEDQKLHAACIIEEFSSKVVMDMGGDLEDILEVCTMVADQSETVVEDLGKDIDEGFDEISSKRDASSDLVESFREREVAGSDWSEGLVRMKEGHGGDVASKIEELTEDEEHKWEVWNEGNTASPFFGS